MQNEIKVNDEFIFHSSDGNNYKIVIYNINYYRPPDSTFAILVYDENNNLILSDANDEFWFIGEEFFIINEGKIEKCEIKK